MKKIYGFIAVIIVLSMFLSGCNSGADTINKNTDTGATHTDDESIAEVNNTDTGAIHTDDELVAEASENIYGTLTDKYYINEWLGLFLDLSLYDMAVLTTPGTIEALRSASTYIDETTILDMSVENKYSSAKKPLQISIYISDTQGKTLDECISKIVEAEKNILTKEELQRTTHFNTEDTIDFQGEQYLPLHVTKEEFTFTNDNGMTYQYPFESIWCLCRIKNDKLITIRCRSYYTDIPPEKYSFFLKKTDDITNIADYYTVKKTNYSEEQLGKKIINTLLEETIHIYKAPSYAECIDRLFKDYTWTFKPLSGYDYLYVATFTGTYYLVPMSYYELGEDTAYGSFSLLVDVREKDEVRGAFRVGSFDDDNTEGKRIYNKLFTLINDCPQRTT